LRRPTVDTPLDHVLLTRPTSDLILWMKYLGHHHHMGNSAVLLKLDRKTNSFHSYLATDMPDRESEKEMHMSCMCNCVSMSYM